MFNVDDILILKALQGTITPAEKKWLDHQLLKNPQLKAKWLEKRDIWNSEKVQQWITREKHWTPPAPRQHIIINRKSIAVAAVVLALLTSSIVWFLQPTNAKLATINTSTSLTLSNREPIDLNKAHGTITIGDVSLKINPGKTTYAGGNTAAYATLKVGDGQEHSITLEDGTTVHLNSATSLQFPLRFSGNKREVVLSGEAWFEVTKNKNQPFIVHIPGQNTVRVLGTSFNVNSYDSTRVIVSLVEGAVRLHHRHDSLLLHPGQQAITARHQLQTRSFNEQQELSWRNGIFEFYNTPVTDICKMMPRWFGVNVVIDQPGRNTRFTGFFNRKEPLTASLETMKATEKLDYRFDKDSVLHLSFKD